MALKEAPVDVASARVCGVGKAMVHHLVPPFVACCCKHPHGKHSALSWIIGQQCSVHSDCSKENQTYSLKETNPKIDPSSLKKTFLLVFSSRRAQVFIFSGNNN